MTAPLAPAPVDDTKLVRGCIEGDESAWKMLRARYGELIEVIAVRVLDERRVTTLEEVPAVLAQVLGHLARNDAAALGGWDGSSGLRPYLAVVARQVAQSWAQDATPAATVATALTAPAVLSLDDMVDIEPARQMTEALDRQSPHLMALVRLRLRGLHRGDITAVLGMTQQAVLAGLERVAERAGHLQEPDAAAVDGHVPDAVQAWRLLLDCATVTERVHTALRSEADGAFRKVRAVAETTWGALRERALLAPQPRTASCLDEQTVAAFTDGSMKGASRARTEGHLSTCGRCVDVVAALKTDLETGGPLRHAAGGCREVALAAACLATGRFRAARQLAEMAVEHETATAEALTRLARIGFSLSGRRDEGLTAEPSRVVSRSHVPSDEEAPLVALEALAVDDLNAAARAVDDHMARQIIGTRLRLLTNAAGHDMVAARVLAEELGERSHPDPDLLVDAEAVRALPPGQALPREILVERLRDLLPLAVRVTLAR